MKFKYILFALLLINISTFSQEKKDLRIGIFVQMNSLKDVEQPMFGLNFEYFLNHNVSLNYKYGLGFNNQGKIMAHINPSILSLIFIQSPDAIAFSFMIPEGVSYHFYPKENLDVAPYINPLGSEINMYDEQTIVLSGSFGLNLHIRPISDFSITPNLNATIIYSTLEVVPSIGISMNYNFK